MKIHIVQKGDTLWKIAKKYGVNFEELKKMNSQLSNPDMIMPGMKVKIPTTGGNIKKEAPLGMKPSGVQKEMPIAKEQPIAMPIKEAPVKEVPIKEVPIKEVPIKEAPIAKEVPNAPYTPKMPLQIIPEIDINNYYTMNMQNMTVETPPPPPKANIIPEKVPIKEAPVAEAPIQAPPPPPPAPEPVQMECQDYCVPVTPVMPGPGFCPPFDPVMPFHSVPYPVSSGFMPQAPVPGYVPSSLGYSDGPPVPGVNPSAAGTSFMTPHYEDESSSFMPQLPMTNPGYQQGGFIGTQNPYIQQPGSAYMNPAGQYPAGGYPMASGYPGAVPPAEYPSAYHQGVPSGYAGEYPGGYPPAGQAGIPGGYAAGSPAGYPAGVQGGYPAAAPGTYYSGFPSGYPAEVPGTYHTGIPAGYQMGYPGGTPSGPVSEPGYMNPAITPQYGQYPYGYPQMGGPAPAGMGGTGFDYPEYMQQRQETGPAQSLPVVTGALGDCGCGAPPAQPQIPEQSFVPPTPPIYSAPFTSPVTTLQPPLMNPYGMESIGINPYGIPRYQEESNEHGN